MSKKIELLEDVTGINENGMLCHPFKGLVRDKKGKFSFTLSSDNISFRGVTEMELRELLESGSFNERGRIRMIPFDATSTGGAGALRPISYKGKKLPI